MDNNKNDSYCINCCNDDYCNCDCCNSCCSYFGELWNNNKSKIASKMGIALSILNSVFLIIDTYYPASLAKYIVAGTISAGVFMGGILYQKLVDHYKALGEKYNQLENDNTSLKQSRDEVIRRYTIAINNSNNTTPQSVQSIEPINFEEMHRNNMMNSELNDYVFPEN